jgi:phage terminase large subunit GpA-like protein
MDSLSASSRCQEVAFMKSAQIGGTEAGINWIDYIIDSAPGPSLIVQPTISIAERFSKQRLAPQFELMDSLNEKVNGPKGSNNILEKSFPGGILMLTGANSAAGLRSMPVKNLMLDEIDAYPEDAEGEGDPVDLATARTTTFSRRKIFYCSTPTLEATSKILRKFNEGDQRYYNVPCLECGTLQKLEFNRLKWELDSGGKNIKAVWYECASCCYKMEEHEKPKMFAAGVWVPENPEAEFRSYHINALLSPLGWFSWRMMAKEFINAKGQPDKLKTFVNTRLGEPWTEDGTRIETSDLLSRCEEYSHEIPKGVLILTAGIDVQDDRLECEVTGWGVGRESWLIDYRVIIGDPRKKRTWEDLDDYLLSPWVHESGARLAIQGAFVDSGDGNTALDVYRYTKPRSTRRIYSSKGRGGAHLPLIAQMSKGNKIKAILYILGVDGGKSVVYDSLKISEPGPGFCHFPTGTTESYFLGLTAEKQVKIYKNGRLTHIWKKMRDRNEPLDTRVLNLAMIELLNPNFDLLNQRINKAPRNPEAAERSAARSKRRKGPMVYSKGVK